MIFIKQHTVLLKPILLGFVLLLSCQISAQTKKELETQRQELRKEIQQINDLLIKNQTKEKSALVQLDNLNRQISARTKLINNFNQELNLLSKDISKNQKKYNTLQQSLQRLKKDYAAMIVKSYKNKSKENRLLFVLSSKDFTQAYNRLKYMKQYTTYRQHQGKKIEYQSLVLKQLNDSLKVQKAEKDDLLAQTLKEQDSIKTEQNNHKNLVSQIKRRERKYLAEIRKKQKLETAINRKIEKLIRDAIAKSNKKGSVFKLTPEAKALAAEFVSNRGKLPWPVEKGLIVMRYGKQPHPVVKTATIQSNGIRIATEKGAKARAIFDGKVLAIQLIPGGQKVVLIQHGNYISVYKNLDDVYVEKNQTVTTKQPIGSIHTDSETGQTILAFVLFKEVKTVDPSLWLKM